MSHYYPCNGKAFVRIYVPHIAITGLQSLIYSVGLGHDSEFAFPDEWRSD